MSVYGDFATDYFMRGTAADERVPCKLGFALGAFQIARSCIFYNFFGSALYKRPGSSLSIFIQKSAATGAMNFDGVNRHGKKAGRGGETRTRGLVLPKHARYQLRHTPMNRIYDLLILMNHLTRYQLILQYAVIVYTAKFF